MDDMISSSMIVTIEHIIYFFFLFLFTHCFQLSLLALELTHHS